MARRDPRNRNNRLKVSGTKEVTRPITREHTRSYTTQEYRVGPKQTLPTSPNNIEMYKLDSPIKTSDGTEFTHHTRTGSPVRIAGQSTIDGGRTTLQYAKKVDVEQEDSYTTTDYQTETRPTSRLQALDKRDSDDDSQRKRKLKTNREGRSKLRIKMKGDGSAGRLREGPNAGRKRNKLKVDVQGGGGQPGVNVPR